MSEQCALCVDAEATTQIESPDLFAGLAASELNLDAPFRDVVVPLCPSCRERIDRISERYDTVQNGESLARSDLEEHAGALNPDIVDAASR